MTKVLDGDEECGGGIDLFGTDSEGGGGFESEISRGG